MSSQHKIVALSDAKNRVESWQNTGEKVVFTNGVFDLIHPGHIAYLEDAKSKGDRLIIAVNADESVRTLNKGVARPIKDENSRAIILAALECVDAVVIFGDSTPKEIIATLIPNVLVKGGDYDPQETDANQKSYIVGRETVLENGGKVLAIPFLEGYSTTTLEKKIIEAHK